MSVNELEQWFRVAPIITTQVYMAMAPNWRPQKDKTHGLVLH
jgi:hypothetical protein